MVGVVFDYRSADWLPIFVWSIELVIGRRWWRVEWGGWEWYTSNAAGDS